MKEAKLKYTFLSTYNQTLFIKQELFQGQWCLFISEVIESMTTDYWLLCILRGGRFRDSNFGDFAK